MEIRIEVATDKHSGVSSRGKVARQEFDLVAAMGSTRPAKPTEG
jgi:hypothetical protein